MIKKVISTHNAPAAIGPYSQAILSGNTLYCSGQIAINPATGNLTYAAVGGTAPYTFSWQNSPTLFAEASASLNNIIGEN